VCLSVCVFVWLACVWHVACRWCVCLRVYVCVCVLVYVDEGCVFRGGGRVLSTSKALQIGMCV